MNPSLERTLFWLLLVLSLLLTALLFFAPKDMHGDTNTTDFALRTLLYPSILGWLIFAWRSIDRKLKNGKPGEEE